MTAPPGLHAAIEFSSKEITVRLAGEIDLYTAPQLTAVFDAAAGLRPTRVVVDLADVRFLDAAGLKVIAGLAVRLQAGNGQVILRSASPMTSRLLHIFTDLSELLENTPPAAHTPEEASSVTDGAVVHSLDEMRFISTQRRQRTIDCAAQLTGHTSEPTGPTDHG